MTKPNTKEKTEPKRQKDKKIHPFFDLRMTIQLEIFLD